VNDYDREVAWLHDRARRAFAQERAFQRVGDVELKEQWAKEHRTVLVELRAVYLRRDWRRNQ